MTRRRSTHEHWQNYWHGAETTEETYTNADRVVGAVLDAVEPTGLRVLEVGAGTGRDAVRLSALGARVTVLDYVHQSLQIVRANAQQGGADVSVVHADAFSMPFVDGTFDLVFHQGLLEHFRDPAPLLAENARVLAPGGRLVVDVPQRWHVYTAVKHALIAADKWFAGWETEFSLRELERLVIEQGLVVDVRYGDWMSPSFFYRALRRGLADRGWAQLPLRPPQIPAVRSARSALRERMHGTAVAFHTYSDIGVVARKPG